MRSYAAQTRDRLKRQKVGLTEWREAWNARAKQYEVLQRRRQEDTDWLAESIVHPQIVVNYRALPRNQRATKIEEWQVHKGQWTKREQERSKTQDQRKVENQAWHQAMREHEHREERIWFAVLIVTDNCSRQCLELPIFASGCGFTRRIT